MAVKIRLSRVGKKGSPFYRIVAMDSRKKRDGGALEILGTYDPLNNNIVHFHADRIAHWESHGATKTDAVKKIEKLYKQAA
jgi:small subunit ribosomal protein S16